MTFICNVGKINTLPLSLSSYFLAFADSTILFRMYSSGNPLFSIKTYSSPANDCSASDCGWYLGYYSYFASSFLNGFAVASSNGMSSSFGFSFTSSEK